MFAADVLEIKELAAGLAAEQFQGAPGMSVLAKNACLLRGFQEE
jgi:hypothetical protein